MNVADINFVETDTDQIKTNIITIYESLTGRTLAQGDPVSFRNNCKRNCATKSSY